MLGAESSGLIRTAALAAVALAAFAVSTTRGEAASPKCFWICTCLAGYNGQQGCCPKRVCNPASSGSKAFGAAAQSRTPLRTLPPATPVSPPRRGRLR
jgi:hypothetical protein